MNTKNNSRRKASVEKLEKTFMELLEEKEIKDISVSDICKLCKLNRSTFYSNFLDIYDLADKLCEKIEKDFDELFKDEKNREKDGALKMFTHIQENQIFYKTYFKLDYDKKHEAWVYDKKRAEDDFNNEHIKYHMEFFRGGINAIIKMWLNNGCKETPQEMSNILKREYKGR